MKLKVAVFFGGESVEHEISVISANQAMKALDVNKYDVLPIYISKDREMYFGEELFDLNNYKDLNELTNKLTKIVLVKEGNKVKIEPVKKGLFSKTIGEIDVVIPVVHGTNVEDGVMQGYLEMLKLPYSSSDVIASAIGQDKVVMKCVLEQANIKMTDWFWIYGFELDERKEEVKKKAEKIGYPLIIKPACLGSSIGINFADNYDELLEAIEDSSQYDNKIIIEKRLEDFKEVNCSVLGSIYKAKASVLEQVNMDSEFLSFDGKYGKGNKKKAPVASKGMASTQRQVPADLTKEKTQEIKDLALKVFKQLGASGVVRIDFLIDSDDNVLVNEINNIPGSLAFYLWQPEGVDFSALMDELVEIALNKQAKKEKMTFSYDTNILENYKEGNKLK
ncbi:MAG: D-alanine--D-alanine ligase family protein [Erysipelotrichaceae bacterium]